MEQEKETPGIMLIGKKNFMEWKEYIIILIESKGLDFVLTSKENLIEENDSSLSEEGNNKTTIRASKAKVLTIIRKHLDMSLHYLIHGIKQPHEAIEIIEQYCIGNKNEHLLLLEDQLNTPEGRYFLERLKNFNTSFKNFRMLGGQLDEQKVIHKLFLLSPPTMDVLLCIQLINYFKYF
eukprot:snap_masked-scaffold_30-processed-gene-3.105-mRNA-1 protein AED:1.00 eAED:1.00 QI:0/-1/0/0/-1/1/1/0/178